MWPMLLQIPITPLKEMNGSIEACSTWSMEESPTEILGTADAVLTSAYDITLVKKRTSGPSGNIVTQLIP